MGMFIDAVFGSLSEMLAAFDANATIKSAGWVMFAGVGSTLLLIVAQWPHMVT